ncbi:MAG: D-2-hydroxyacid dehydrogenase [Opitutus sp.]
MKLLLNAGFTFTPEQRQALLACVPELQVTEQLASSPDDLDGEGVTVLVTEQVPRDLTRWKNLGWVQLLSAGANQLLGHPIQSTAIPVTTASGTHGVPIAQYVTCVTLMLAHRMPQVLEFKPSRRWPNRTALAGTTLRGRTAGIIGYGSIGRECARQLSALGLRILCLKRDPSARRDHGFTAWPDTGDPEGELPEAWYGPDQLQEFLPRCDLIVVTVPSTPATEGMIGEKELAWCKPEAHLVIISRGGIVIESALAQALRAGRLAGAAVDCFVREPVAPDHEFFDVPNLILTPHMSGVYTGFWALMNGLLCENLQRFARGRPLLNVVNRQHGY